MRSIELASVRTLEEPTSTLIPPIRRDLFQLADHGVAAAQQDGLATSDELRVGLVLPAGHPASRAVKAGASLGVAEATRLASLLGRSFALEVEETSSPRAARAAAIELSASGLRVVGGVSAAFANALADLPEVVLIRARSELEPGTAPDSALSVTPSWEQHADALVAALFRQGWRRFSADSSSPLAERAVLGGLEPASASAAEIVLADAPAADADSCAASSADSCARWIAGVTPEPRFGVVAPVGWHPRREEFGGGQLNQRFLRATGTAMDENAWYGWIAVKLVIEATLLGVPLAALCLDGHKGALLRFEDACLEQPLYVVSEELRELDFADA